MRTLHLTLKSRWFDMEASGIKKQEYREIKPFWCCQLLLYKGAPATQDFWNNLIAAFGLGKSIEKGLVTFAQYDIVRAYKGYAKNRPEISWKYQETRIGKPNPEWCDPDDVDNMFFILDIGDINQ